MKKLLSIFLAVALLSVLLVFPVNAVENGNKYLDKYIDQYHNGRYPTGFDADVFEYEELYYHYPNGSDEPDWALIKADSGTHCEVLTYDVFFGRAFANNDVAVPFTYGRPVMWKKPLSSVLVLLGCPSPPVMLMVTPGIPVPSENFR